MLSSLVFCQMFFRQFYLVTCDAYTVHHKSHKTADIRAKISLICEIVFVVI